MTIWDPRNPHTISHIETLCKVLLPLIQSDFELPASKTGGILEIFISKDSSKGPASWHKCCTIRFGMQADESSWEAFEFFSSEKTTRLMKETAVNGHISSWQTRNRDRWEFGGAILLEVMLNTAMGPEDFEIIISSSGLNEVSEETICMATAKNLEWGDEERYAAILSVSDPEGKRKLTILPSMKH